MWNSNNEIAEKIANYGNIPQKKIKFYNFMRAGFAKDSSGVFEIWYLIETSKSNVSTVET